MNGGVARVPRLPAALLLLASVWSTLLLCQVLLEPRFGRSEAVLVSFALASGLVLAARDRPIPRVRAAHLAALGLGGLAGAASYPLWIGLIATIGTHIGLDAPAATPARPDVLLGVATVIVAPAFEEILYREYLLQALRRTVGAASAVLLSSAAFAVSHLDTWAILGTFLVGLGLGTLMCRFGSLATCIGLHAGLNLTAWFPQ